MTNLINQNQMVQHQNSITLRGNIGAAPKLTTTARNNPMMTFSVALDRFTTPVGSRGPKQKQTDWAYVMMFGSLVEQLGPRIKKGNNVTVTGHLNTWRGDDGMFHYSIIAEDVQINPDRRSYSQVRFGGVLALDSFWYEDTNHPSNTKAAQLTIAYYAGARLSSETYTSLDFPSTGAVTNMVVRIEGQLAAKFQAVEDALKLHIGQDVEIQGNLVIVQHENRQQYVIEATQIDIYEESDVEEKDTDPDAFSSFSLADLKGVSIVEEAEGGLNDLDVLNDPRWQAQHDPAQHLTAFEAEAPTTYLQMLRVLSPLANTLSELILYFYENYKNQGMVEGAAWCAAQNLFIERVSELGLITHQQKLEYQNMLLQSILKYISSHQKGWLHT